MPLTKRSGRLDLQSAGVEFQSAVAREPKSFIWHKPDKVLTGMETENTTIEIDPCNASCVPAIPGFDSCDYLG
jgi:hypothetical protein